MALSPTERTMRASLASHTSWANTNDPVARTAPARAAFLDRFEKAVDPTGELPPDERARRAEHARRAYMTGLALKSAKARRRGKRAVSDEAAA